MDEENKEVNNLLFLEKAEVMKVDPISPVCEELEVIIGYNREKAINYIPLTGRAKPGEKVVVNTAAVRLGLGTGGNHFVLFNFSSTLQKNAKISGQDGHVIKMRYTPMQVRVKSVEEKNSPYHETMAVADNLNGLPVVVAELHSALAPLVLTIKREKPEARIAYVMTDGGALPAYFSRTVQTLSSKELIAGIITCGHAFGGNFEAVNVYSGLLAARHVLKADIAIVSMGPGVTGTGTVFGYSGAEMGENINRVNILGGRAIALPRLSFADRRDRHFGFSHHTVTALQRISLTSADLPLPVISGAEGDVLVKQLAAFGLGRRHRVSWYFVADTEYMEASPVPCSTMGRNIREDEHFFMAAAAAGHHASALI